MRDIDSPIVCGWKWGYLTKRMNNRRSSLRDSRLSKSRAGYKESDPYMQDYVMREDAINFLCVDKPGMR